MDAIVATRHWLEEVVIGLNLCPFARGVHLKRQIRWVESPARDVDGLLADLVRELQLLAAADPEAVDTTLLIHPHVLNDFLDYNDFLDVADAAVVQLGLDGVLQVASFHPDYRSRAPSPTMPATSATARRVRRCTCCASRASTAPSPRSRRRKRSTSATSKRCGASVSSAGVR